MTPNVGSTVTFPEDGLRRPTLRLRGDLLMNGEKCRSLSKTFDILPVIDFNPASFTLKKEAVRE